MKSKRVTVHCEFCFKPFQLSVKHKGTATCPYCGTLNDDMDKSPNRKNRRAAFTRRLNKAIKKRYPSTKAQKTFKELGKSLKGVFKKEYAEALFGNIKIMLANGDKEGVMKMAQDILNSSKGV